jgi:FkbM family methyltransferase
LHRLPAKNFIHVGANDLGGADDEGHSWIIGDPEWRSVLVEPQPRAMDRLRRNIGGARNVTLVNAAIADHDGTAELTVYRRDRWSSMAPRTHEMRDRFNEPKHLVQVACMTAASLLRQTGIDAPGFLIIDTEGLDKEILDQFLDIGRPAMIICEIAHVPPDGQTAVLKRFADEGYVYCVLKGVRDVLALRVDLAGRT